MTTKKNNDNKLLYLHEVSGQHELSIDPDIRGWKLQDAQGQTLGFVDNLVVNTEKDCVVYVDLEVDEGIIKNAENTEGIINKDGENHILIPIGLVTPDKNKNTVFTSRISRQNFGETKRMKKNTPVSRDYEIAVLDSYSQDPLATGKQQVSEDNFYDRKEFDDYAIGRARK